MIYEVPLQNIPSQKLRINVDDHECSLWLFQKGERLYLDLDVDSQALIRAGVCLSDVPIIQKAQNILMGNFAFISLSDRLQPHYTSINTDHILIYFSADEDIAFLQKNSIEE